jgi:hypothetical protein
MARPSSRSAFRQLRAAPRRLPLPYSPPCRHIRQSWPSHPHHDARHSHYARFEAMDWCQANGVRTELVVAEARAYDHCAVACNFALSEWSRT